ARSDDSRISTEQSMLYFYRSLFDLYGGGLVIVIDRDIERCAAHRDYGRRRHYAVRIRNRAEMLNVHSHFSQKDVDQVSPVAVILAEDESRIGINLDGAPV